MEQSGLSAGYHEAAARVHERDRLHGAREERGAKPAVAGSVSSRPRAPHGGRPVDGSDDGVTFHFANGSATVRGLDARRSATSVTRHVVSPAD